MDKSPRGCDEYGSFICTFPPQNKNKKAIVTLKKYIYINLISIEIPVIASYKIKMRDTQF